ncbi:threonine/homoserine/homoserine lactone efflux protein [Thermocatellispora tengchongensis]|uniref:Threonine/homoserine/homoserine lactone efflux protein n=1 Tax=Thermocatellispora tengchongensis TaxID=1073253 RepID=A0A840NZ56_9ACTN|nr:LysE family translocator [Thermocatellispora tengchongensis]MBB5130420.1 threonine/homoserine/homoserine lactone efflux protein [Thermocatellispora tengchongensis]
MPDMSAIVIFCGATLALLLVPGPAVLYIVTRSVAQGRTAGLTSVLGIHAGSVVHVAAAALGISALLAASATAFTVVKLLGAAYLIWLGVRKLLARAGDGAEEAPAQVAGASNARLFWEGALVNVLNPKTAIFFMAFLPQFVDPHAGPVAPQIMLLGLIWIALGVASDSGYAVLAAFFATRLRRSARARRRLDVGSGVVYISLGATAALTGEPPRA